MLNDVGFAKSKEAIRPARVYVEKTLNADTAAARSATMEAGTVRLAYNGVRSHVNMEAVIFHVLASASHVCCLAGAVVVRIGKPAP